jgi:hypothetical protein
MIELQELPTGNKYACRERDRHNLRGFSISNLPDFLAKFNRKPESNQWRNLEFAIQLRKNEGAGTRLTGTASISREFELRN